jgi:hypothetical protein
MRPDSISILQNHTGKLHIYFTDRGNTSILLAMKLGKHIGKKRVVLQDQGGWITYEQYAKKLKLEVIKVKTDFGIVDVSGLRDILREDDLVLLNSMPGYYALQENMSRLHEICLEKGAFLINDVSGSIGTSASRHGDIMVGSFGEWKPVEVKYGGFIAFDSSSHGEFIAENNTRPVKDFYEDLLPELKRLSLKQKEMFSDAARVKRDLKDKQILHPDHKGYNVIVAFSDEQEKASIVEYCAQKGYEYTLCPRYIRVLADAVSIELKR